ncbi:hypothetical protein Q5P01_011240 [Channa striata]|uniref:Extracellular matrix protein 1 n=1 Tax=Channa striata TaxID=64152 RepID=A0AA88MSX4_CHASR|nr:hypothetical protein Q5P01_011240 [Channa striata]
MDSSWALVCSSALVLVLLASASGDEDIHMQREVTEDLQTSRQDSFMEQRPLDLSDLFREEISMSQNESKPPVERYPVQFPLGRPTSDNIEAICLYGDRRPLYPDSYFPRSGFSSQARKGSAVNKAESWFSTCCEGRQTWEREVTLCCATQAWELSIESFCNEEFSIKTRHYTCCQLRGTERLNCFHNNAPNPNYEPTQEIPAPPLPSTTTDTFVFDPNTCQREIEPSTSRRIDINFPPGQPTADSIKSLCQNQIFRPLYDLKCLAGSEHELLARQAKTINRMEKGFEQCCKKQDILDCAEGKWREEIKRFCLGKKGGSVVFHCCLGDRRNDRYNCFKQSSPDPYYNMTSTDKGLTVAKICDAHKIIKKMFPLQSFVDQCCPLSNQDESMCSVQRLVQMLMMTCLSRSRVRYSPAVRRCCHVPPRETPLCVSKLLTNVITKATRVSRQKKKCPIS